MNNNNIKNWCLVLALALSAPVTSNAASVESQTQAETIQQANDCTGVVRDADGESLLGASVRVNGTTIGVSTNIDGEFTIKGVKLGSKLTISYIGCKPVTVTWNGQPIEVTLAEDKNILDEVVVMGYGIEQKRANVTNSIAKVSEKTLTVGTNANPAQALAGAVSGVKVAVTTGNPSSTPKITVRGGTNFDGGSNQPLVVVDGNIRDGLNDINPNDIASMEILKDAGATALYGARAGNGVILITTKSGSAGKGKITFSGKVGLGYYDNGYESVSDEDFLYILRTTAQNTHWVIAGGTYQNNFPGMMFTNANNPGSLGRTKWENTMNYNILRKNENTEYLLGKGGWKEMLDPISDITILYWNQDVSKVNQNNPTVTQDYNLTFSGGNDRGKYYASLGYYDADGVIKRTFYKRYNFAFTGEYKINDWLTSNSVFNYIRANWKNDDPMLNTEYFMNRGYMYKFVRYYDEEGNQLHGTGNPTININDNKDNFMRDNQSDKFSMTQSVTAKIIDGLTLKGTMAWYYNEQYTASLNRAYVTNQIGAANPFGTAGVNRAYAQSASFLRYFDQTYNLVANFNRTFAEKHNINVMAGMEFYKRKYLAFSASGSGGPSPLFNLGLTANNKNNMSRNISSDNASEALLSYFGRVEYNYDGKYLLAATFREDGYSRLLDNRWGFFPGVSAGWVFSKENFWKDNPNLSFINYAKLRASYGSNAIINTRQLGYYTLQGAYSSYQYDGNIGYRISTLPNPRLKWETARTGEVGIDLGFFQNRANLGVTYYNRTTIDKYAALALPHTTGFSSVTDNNGSYRNEGVEIDINGTILQTRDFRWSIGANLTYNKNRIVELPDNGLPNNRQGGTEVYTGGPQYKNEAGEMVWPTYYIGGYQEGQNPYQKVGYGTVKIARTQNDIDALGDYIDISQTAGIYANESGRKRLLNLGYTDITPLVPGDMIFQDMNGDNIIDVRDQKIIGHTDPSWTGGFNTTFSWKGLSLYARFDMGFGFQVYDSNLSFLLGEGQGAMSFPLQAHDTWSVDNPNAKYPRITNADQYGTNSHIRTSELYTQNGNYLACRELSLSYQLPANICRKLFTQELTLSITGQNLGYIKSCTIPLPDNVTYWSGNTAGNGGTYNLPRQIIFGLNVTF